MNGETTDNSTRSGQYRHLFFDLDHTLWDFDANSRQTLQQIHDELELEQKGVTDFDLFHKKYLAHNERLWEKYRNGLIKVDELRWKRMALTLLDFKIGNEPLARQMGVLFLDLLPTRTLLFPHTREILTWLVNKKYSLHLITNGFEKTQWSKLKHSGLDHFFQEMISSESANSLKPHREIFEFALAKTGATREESIMLGDSLDVDIQGAMDAGIDQVFVNHLNLETSLQPTYTVSSLKELELIF